MDKGANVNAKDDLGETALMNAAESGDTNAVEILLARGADINAVDAEGLTALGLVGIERGFGYAAIAQLLRQAGANALSASGSSFNAVVASGTNTDSSGYVSNAVLLTPFTLTNSAGNVVTDAVLVKLMPNKFLYKTLSGGEMAIRPLESLSKDLQEKFGYDPQVAQVADYADQQKKARQQALAQQQQLAMNAQAKWDAALATALKHKGQLEGKVIQKISGGLLVSMNEKIYLLKDYPGYDNAVSDDYVNYPTFGIGSYTYETVNKSENTIRTLTCSTNVAVNYYLTH